MRRTLFYLSVALLAFGVSFTSDAQSVYGQKSKQRTYFIESQPDSPILIRDLTATIVPVNKFRNSPEMEVVFYFENTSKKKIKRYTYQDPTENDLNYKDYEERGWGGELLPGASDKSKSTGSIEGEAVVYRVKEVEFEDGTKWKAKPFNPAKAKKSARITAQKNNLEQPETTSKRIMAREWSEIMLADRVLKVLEGTPQTIEGIKVQTKLYELKPERLDMVESCDVQNDGLGIAYNEFDYDVEKFTAYEIKGKIFAYQVDYELIEAENAYQIGAGIGQIYVDEEGNGVFKVRCDKTELDSLPKWIKELAGK